MSSILKTIIILVVLGGIGFFGYTYFSNSSTDSTTLVSDSNDTTKMGAQVLTALNQLKQLTLDGSVFTNRTFRSLKDFSRPIPEEPKSRANPFAPLGVETALDAQRTAAAAAAAALPKVRPQPVVPTAPLR